MEATKSRLVRDRKELQNEDNLSLKQDDYCFADCFCRICVSLLNSSDEKSTSVAG